MAENLSKMKAEINKINEQKIQNKKKKIKNKRKIKIIF